MKESFALTLLLAALLLPVPATAQTEEPTCDPEAEPYVFVLFDTSGSMNLSTRCTQEQFDAGECSLVCPTGNCYASLHGDDPASKFYVAKEALHSVLSNTSGVRLGFATFDQDSLEVASKHWLYEATSSGIMIPGWGPFPAQGAREVFGALWNCDTGSGDHEIGCVSTKPADLSDGWELGRVQRLAKGGVNFTQTVDFYVRHAGFTYRVRHQPLTSVTPGAPFQNRVTIWRCQNSTCSATLTLGISTVSWTPVAEFLSWDNGATNPNRTNPALNYFSQDVADAWGTTACEWDPNTDTTSDRNSSLYNLRWITTSDPRGTAYSKGDVLPWDWMADHAGTILGRLAPNQVLNPAAVPDFRTSAFFRDRPFGSDPFLRLKNESERPLVAYGASPLGGAVKSVNLWVSSWGSIAAAQDPDWTCRRKYLIVLTDEENNSGCLEDPCDFVTMLSNQLVSTYVVGLSTPSVPLTSLDCMATAGGTGTAYYPDNRQQLIDALNGIFSQILTSP